jgi:hypothetical protein
LKEGGIKEIKNSMKWKMEVCIVKDKNELEFQRLPEHHPFYGKGPHVEHPLAWYLL